MSKKPLHHLYVTTLVGGQERSDATMINSLERRGKREGGREREDEGRKGSERREGGRERTKEGKGVRERGVGGGGGEGQGEIEGGREREEGRRGSEREKENAEIHVE